MAERNYRFLNADIKAAATRLDKGQLIEFQPGAEIFTLQTVNCRLYFLGNYDMYLLQLIMVQPVHSLF